MAADPLTSATVDDLLNFDHPDDEGPFNDKSLRRNERDDKPTLSPRNMSKRKADDLDDKLGLETEVKIKKQRKPIAKLDDARLLSAPGIPKLRADARMSNFLTKKLRIKGKGHEFSDVARLLNYYQLWLDDLYPRAKFADGLQLVEKAGHSRRMQVARKEWIDEGKPGYIREREAKKKADKDEREQERKTDEMYAGGEETMMSGANNEPLNEGSTVVDDSLFIPDSRTTNNAAQDDAGLPEDDELDALLAEQDTRTTTRPTTVPRRIIEDDSEGEDDLDALLAEQESRKKASAPAVSTPAPKSQSQSFDDDDEDMDDLDALLAEQEARSRSNAAREVNGAPALEGALPGPMEDEFPVDDEDDLDALLADQEARETLQEHVPPPPSTSAKSSVPAMPIMHGEIAEAEVDGADMFSSSPVRGTTPTSMLPGDEDLSASAGVEATPPHEQDEDKVQGDKEEESQGLDADDMFSSSPV
ncbi:chromosome segregation in meiosis- protein [Cladophialophora chaetospira]|uniref:Chromosome segregation in meiosis protein n=1 Tax=Cladophialophora chaetospira TaxID=386627 RepID=A0AA39CH12_9EURO|nr:chromosome segregation in meiosis- protein [Cladophialophora chaetospira]